MTAVQYRGTSVTKIRAKNLLEPISVIFFLSYLGQMKLWLGGEIRNIFRHQIEYEKVSYISGNKGNIIPMKSGGENKKKTQKQEGC